VHIRELVLLQRTHQVPHFPLSIGDDNVIYKWNVNTGQSSKWLDLDSYAIDHDWMPFSRGSSDVAAVGFADGSIKLINKNGKV
jgi:WD40 repeat protein